MKNKIRIICDILFFSFLMSCGQDKGIRDVVVEYKGNNIFISYDGKKEYIKIPFNSVEQLKEKVPAYCIDTSRNMVYTFIPAFGIKKFDLTSKKLIEDYHLDFKYHKWNHSFQLRTLNDYIVFLSYTQVLIFNKKLELKADLRDTIERNLCSELALHKYETEFSGDTLLFKAMFVEKSDFRSNKRYKRIFKDYEFVLRDGEIKCANCDKCKNKNNLTKEQMERLLNDPY